MNVIPESLDLLVRDIHADRGECGPRVGTAAKYHQYRFAFQFANGQLPGPRPTIVVVEVRGILKLARKPVCNVEPRISADQFANSVPIAAVEVIHIKLHDSQQFRVRCANRRG